MSHRLVLDHPDRVERLAVLDIAPTRTVFETVDQTVATVYYHWFFLIQPNGLPEKLIGHDPDDFLQRKLTAWGADGDAFTDEAVAEYKRCFRDPAAIHASCEDYRAAASIDLEHDRADEDARIACPLLALWGNRGLVGRRYDVLNVWREKADDVRGEGPRLRAFPAGGETEGNPGGVAGIPELAHFRTPVVRVRSSTSPHAQRRPS